MKKIAVIGPESTGKTTLSNWLSKQFPCAFIPESLRHYCDIHGTVLSVHDMIIVAQLHYSAIQTATHAIIDTDILSLALWCKLYFNQIPDAILQLIREQNIDFFLLCNIDIPWVADPQREFPHRRQEHFDLFLQYLQKYQLPFELVSGNGEERFQNAYQIVKKQEDIRKII